MMMQGANEDEYFESELIDFIAEVQKIQEALAQTGNVGKENSNVIQPIIDRCVKTHQMPIDQHVRLLQTLSNLSGMIYGWPDLFSVGWNSLIPLYNSARTLNQNNRHQASQAQKQIQVMNPRPPPRKRPFNGYDSRPAKMPYRGPEVKLDLGPPKKNRDLINSMQHFQDSFTEYCDRIDQRLTGATQAKNNTGICFLYQNDACKNGDRCRWRHVCWQCMDNHPAKDCPVASFNINQARAEKEEVCIRWNLTGCKMGYRCRYRHVCLVCFKPHPFRHSKECLAINHLDVKQGKEDVIKLHQQNTRLDDPHLFYHNNRIEPGKYKEMTKKGNPLDDSAKYLAPVITHKLTSDICVNWNISNECLCDDFDCGFNHVCLKCFKNHKLIECPYFRPWMHKFGIGDAVRNTTDGICGKVTEIHEADQSSSMTVQMTAEESFKMDVRSSNNQPAPPELLFSRRKQIGKCKETNHVIITDLPEDISKQDLTDEFQKQVELIGFTWLARWEVVDQDAVLRIILSVPERENLPAILDKITEVSIGKNKLRATMLTMPAKNDKSVERWSCIFYCSLCDQELSSVFQAKAHSKSPEHVNKESNGYAKRVMNTIEQIGKSQKDFCRLCDTQVDMKEPKKHLQSDAYKEKNYLFAFSFLNMKPLEDGSIRCMACAKDYRSLKLFMLHCQTPHHRANLEAHIEPCVLWNCRAGCANKKCEFAHVCFDCRGAEPKYRCNLCRDDRPACDSYGSGGCREGEARCRFKHICTFCGQWHPISGCPYQGYPPKVYDAHGRSVY